MEKYLTTDELVSMLDGLVQIGTQDSQKQKKIKKVKTKQSLTKRKKIIRITYFVLLALAILHIIYISIPLIAPNAAVNIIGRQYIMAVPNDQELDDELDTRIVSIKPFNIDNLNVGDVIVIYGKFGTDVYWMEEVVEIREDLNELDASFDGFLRNTYTYDEIGGVVNNPSNIFGTLLFVSSRTRGYIALIVTYSIVFGMTYYFYIRKKDEDKVNLSE